MKKIKKERTNQDRTKIGPFFDFLLHLSILLLGIFSIEKCMRNPKKGPILVLSHQDKTKIASQLSCEAMFKISSENIGENRRKDQFWSYLHCSFLA